MAQINKAMTLVVFFMFLNGVPNLMVASGVAEDMGVNLAVGGGENIGEANQAMDDIRVSGGFANTLFALYTSVTGPLKTVFEVLLGGELMFISLGVPAWLMAFFFLPKYIILGGATIYALAGRRV